MRARGAEKASWTAANLRIRTRRTIEADSIVCFILVPHRRGA